MVSCIRSYGEARWLLNCKIDLKTLRPAVASVPCITVAKHFTVLSGLR